MGGLRDRPGPPIGPTDKPPILKEENPRQSCGRTQILLSLREAQLNPG